MNPSEMLALLQETGPRQALTLDQPTLGRRTPAHDARMPMTKLRPRLHAEALLRFCTETSPKIRPFHGPSRRRPEPLLMKKQSSLRRHW